MQKCKDIEYLLKTTRPKDVMLNLINFTHSEMACLNRRLSEVTSLNSFLCLQSCPLLYFLVTDLQTVLLMFFLKIRLGERFLEQLLKCLVGEKKTMQFSFAYYKRMIYC